MSGNWPHILDSNEVTQISFSSGKYSTVKKKTAQNGLKIGRTTKLNLLLIASSVSCIYFVYMLLYHVSKDPFPRPVVVSKREELSIDQKTDHMPCRLPDLKAFDDQVKKFIQQPERVDCAKDHPQIFKTDLKDTIIQVVDPSTHGYSECCFQSFRKVEDIDHHVRYSKTCVPITTTETVVKPPIEFVRISCVKDKHVVPVDFFGFTRQKTVEAPREHVLPVPEREDRHRYRKGGKENIRKVNVVILSFDTVSHMNFQRVMPLSYAYLNETLSAVGMSGYTKVGGNTWPNFMPAFTGFSLDELEKYYWNMDKFFDDCPFIWKNFSSQGYRTGYGEDASGLGNFKNKGRKGFQDSPVDYYYNILTFEMDESIGHTHRENSDWCYGSRFSFEILLDFMQKMAFNLNKVQPYFQLVWATSLTHDELNGGMLGDQFLLDTLTWFNEGGYMDDTVLILMSDHGITSGDILATLQGKLESRMPLLYFTLPPWFIEQYPSAVHNLKTNAQRLTTPFDLHETLLDLRFLPDISDSNVGRRYANLLKKKKRPRGISLFLPVPDDRSCVQAGVPEAHCVCRVRTPVDVKNNELVQEAAKYAVEFINSLFVPYPKCATLTLQSIHDAQVFQAGNSIFKESSKPITSPTDKRLKKQSVTFAISFSTSPSNASFEVTTTRNTDGTWTTLKEIGRINLYRKQSWCVDDPDMKKLCFCK